MKTHDHRWHQVATSPTWDGDIEILDECVVEGCPATRTRIVTDDNVADDR